MKKENRKEGEYFILNTSVYRIEKIFNTTFNKYYCTIVLDKTFNMSFKKTYVEDFKMNMATSITKKNIIIFIFEKG